MKVIEMPVTLQSRIESEMLRLRSNARGSRLPVLDSAQHAACRVNGREVINLASNNYLGLANHPVVKKRARDFLEQWGAGAGAVRAIGGTLSIHEELETRLAAFKGVSDVTLFQSGFMANQGVLGALLKEGDLVVSDALNHASIIDGLRLTKATRKVFAHADAQDLDRVLGESLSDGLKVVATDGVFSMDGDIAPLDRLLAVARRHGAILYVDDAHGSGVMGPLGKGTVHHFGLEDAPDIIQIGTLSKAWGTIGGYAAGASGLAQLLQASARPFLFSTSLPPAVVGAVFAALDLVEQEPLMERLWSNTRYFREELRRLGFDTMGSVTPITPVRFGDPGLAQHASRMLLDLGIFAVAIAFPVVPPDAARIRNIVTADHTKSQLDRALDAYRTVGRELGVI